MFITQESSAYVIILKIYYFFDYIMEVVNEYSHKNVISDDVKMKLWKPLKAYNIEKKIETGLNDWTGTFYKIGSFPSIRKDTLDIMNIPDYPFIDDGFRAGGIEWTSFSIAAYLTMNYNYNPLLIELGCSQGLWCVPWIHCLSKNNVKNVKAMGYEASRSFNSTLDFWESQNLESYKTERLDYAIILSNDKWNFTWYSKGISFEKGIVGFPDIDCSVDNGANISSLSAIRSESNIKKVLIETDSFFDVIRNNKEITYLHLDIQGAEKNIFESENINKLNEANVAVLQIGTHSKEIDQLVLKVMGSLNYKLISSEECQLNDDGFVCRDGEHFWVSNDVYDILVNDNIIFNPFKNIS